MKHASVLGFCIAASAAAPAAAQERVPVGDALHGRHVAHHRTQPSAAIPASATAQIVLPPVEVRAPSLFLPRIAPYPSNDSDDVTGLSRNMDDCNKGCIDTPP